MQTKDNVKRHREGTNVPKATRSQVETWHRYFPRTFRGSMALQIFFLASPPVRQYISVVSGHLVCSALLWQPYETNTGWKSKQIKTCGRHWCPSSRSSPPFPLLEDLYSVCLSSLAQGMGHGIDSLQSQRSLCHSTYHVTQPVQEASLKGLLYPRWR